MGCVQWLCPYIGTYEAADDEREVVFRIETAMPIPFDDLEDYVMNTGPVLVDLDWINEMGELEGDDIYFGPDDAAAYDDKDRHSLLIVGLGTRWNGQGYTHFWIVRNCYGTSWGDGGYAKFSREMIHGRYLINNEGWAPVGISFEGF
ncbi:hypothetical protein TSUD_246530 [Trifolium subterraneum]|uniref:Peptidase C1A papain C-terminal domain-containing protein n=1 Tax=Trifolium subterraneum TaxID=3900 RepID=A0A2Z6P6F6_TRISU|nr:hypothetical protein TSUD_246530 [Trifolium subterraneum]